uniref:SUN domain-containing protein n=1 Tax=Strongyloides venezuelensis TaxID=75913 RepID=A0A0K0G396_STRVS
MAEIAEINNEDHLIKNLCHIPSTLEVNTFKITGISLFNTSEEIHPNDIRLLDDTKCVQYIISDYIKEAIATFDYNGYCKEIKLDFEISEHSNPQLVLFVYTLQNTYNSAIYTFKCLPFKHHNYKSEENFND